MWPHPLNKDPVLISNSFKILHSAFSVIKNIVNLYSDDIQICHQRPNTTLKKGLGELEHKVHSEWFSSVQRLHPMSNRPVFPTAGFHCDVKLESKHLKVRLGPRVLNITFLDQRRSRTPEINSNQSILILEGVANSAMVG